MTPPIHCIIEHDKRMKTMMMLLLNTHPLTHNNCSHKKEMDTLRLGFSIEKRRRKMFYWIASFHLGRSNDLRCSLCLCYTLFVIVNNILILSMVLAYGSVLNKPFNGFFHVYLSVICTHGLVIWLRGWKILFALNLIKNHLFEIAIFYP